MSRSIWALILELAHVEDEIRHATMHSRSGAGVPLGQPALADLARREKKLVEELRGRDEDVSSDRTSPGRPESSEH